MLKYYEYLLHKNLLHDRYNLNVLANLEDFPLHIDETLQEYYEKISVKVCQYDTRGASGGENIIFRKLNHFL